MGWGGWEDTVCMVSDFLYDGVVSPVGFVFRDVYCFLDKVIGSEVFFPLSLQFFGEIASLLAILSDWYWLCTACF